MNVSILSSNMLPIVTTGVAQQDDTNKHHWLIIFPSRLGDAVLATSVLNLLNDYYAKFNNPYDLSLTLVLSPIVDSLFSDCMGLEKIIVFEKKRAKLHWINLWANIVKKRWHGVIDLRGSFLGYAVASNHRSTWRSKRYRYTQSNQRLHKVEQINHFLYTSLPYLFNEKKLYQPFIPIRKQRQLEAQKQYPEKMILCVAPICNWIGKQWPIEYFEKLIHHFCKQFPMACVTLWSSKEEQHYIKDLLTRLPDACTCAQIDNNDLYDLANVAAHFKHAQLFIGNDSGLMHLSAAVGTPTIGLFGPSDDEVYAPWDCFGQKQTLIRSSSFDDIKNAPNFSYATRTQCYMRDLSIKKVWYVLKKKWLSIV
jgi:heptosyltransferase-3